jgi:general secretion pathway protein G
MKIKKHCMTLIEIMIVMALIGIISGVLIYNFRGGIEKGKEFVTAQRAKQIKHILTIESLEDNKNSAEIKAEWQKMISNSSLLDSKQKEDIFKDGWGKDFKLKIEHDEIVITTPSVKDKQW